MAKPKTETPMTPQMTPSSSVNNTPATGIMSQHQHQQQHQSQQQVQQHPQPPPIPPMSAARKNISPLESLSTMI
jgi:hypothetical protein